MDEALRSQFLTSYCIIPVLVTFFIVCLYHQRATKERCQRELVKRQKEAQEKIIMAEETLRRELESKRQKEAQEKIIMAEETRRRELERKRATGEKSRVEELSEIVPEDWKTLAIGAFAVITFGLAWYNNEPVAKRRSGRNENTSNHVAPVLESKSNHESNNGQQYIRLADINYTQNSIARSFQTADDTIPGPTLTQTINELVQFVSIQEQLLNNSASYVFPYEERLPLISIFQSAEGYWCVEGNRRLYCIREAVKSLQFSEDDVFILVQVSDSTQAKFKYQSRSNKEPNQNPKLIKIRQ
jgi:hypothetical protein